jgi:hypothetical protein
MSRNIGTLFTTLVCASTVLASAQTTPSPTDSVNQPASAPVAYVYLTSSPSNGQSQIDGYTAAADGKLTPIPGTPFSTAIYDIVANGTWLFGTDGINLDSFSIAANGSLKQVDTLEVEPDGGLNSLFLDHTGTSLYADYYTTNNEELAYSIDNSTGKLTYLDNIQAGPGFGYVESFVGDNEYAYESTCYQFSPSIYGIQRSSNGAITMLNPNQVYPTARSGDFYCPWSAAADRDRGAAIKRQLDSAGPLSTSHLHGRQRRTAQYNEHLREYAQNGSGGIRERVELRQRLLDVALGKTPGRGGHIGITTFSLQRRQSHHQIHRSSGL